MEEFPVNQYYKDNVVTGKTIKQTARTWIAVLLVKDPRSGFDAVRIYQWHRASDGPWKRRGIITLDRAEQVRDMSGALELFAHKVAESQLVKLQKRISSRAS